MSESELFHHEESSENSSEQIPELERSISEKLKKHWKATAEGWSEIIIDQDYWIEVDSYGVIAKYKFYRENLKDLPVSIDEKIEQLNWKPYLRITEFDWEGIIQRGQDHCLPDVVDCVKSNKPWFEWLPTRTLRHTRITDPAQVLLELENINKLIDAQLWTAGAIKEAIGH